MKFIDILKTANRNLWQNKVRSGLTILAIFVGSFSIVTTTAIQTGVNSFIDSQVDAFGGEGFIQLYADNSEQTLQNAGSSFSGKPTEYTEGDINSSGLTAITPEQIEKVKQIAGIKSDTVLAGNFGTTTYVESTKNSKKFTASLNIMTTGSIHYDLTAGVATDNSASEYQVLLPSEDWVTSLGYADAAEAVGNNLAFVYSDPVTKELIRYDAKIVGVQAPSVIGGGSLVINSALNDKLYDENTKYLPAAEKEKVYTLAAEYDYEHYSADVIKDDLKKIGMTGMTMKDIIGQIKDFFDIILTVFKVFGFVALIAAAIGIINTLFMSVQERTREIGLDKALGMSNGRVFLSFSIEAILLGLWGSIVGTAVSMLVGYGFNSLAHANDGFLQSFPTFNLVEYTPDTVLPFVALVMIIAFISGTLPARAASRKDPIEALRYE